MGTENGGGVVVPVVDGAVVANSSVATTPKAKRAYVKRKDAFKAMSNEAIDARIAELNLAIRNTQDAEAKRVANNERIGLYAERRSRVAATISQNATASVQVPETAAPAVEVPPAVSQ